MNPASAGFFFFTQLGLKASRSPAREAVLRKRLAHPTSAGFFFFTQLGLKASRSPAREAVLRKRLAHPLKPAGHRPSS